MRPIPFFLVPALLGVLGLFGCSGAEPTEPICGGAAWPTDDWSEPCTDDPALDPVLLEQMRAFAFEPGRHTQGVVVIHRGRLVAEWYSDDRDATSRATSWSMAKSYTSALVGIAIDEGLIDGVHVSLAEYYPEWAGTDKEAITLADVLSMASGLGWVEDYNGMTSHIAEISWSPNALDVPLSTDVVAPPGTLFNYSSGDTMLLSGVLETATGMSAGDYAHEKLFDPIGMDGAEWWQDGAGQTLTFCCIDATPRDFAKFGYLYLNDGEWDGRQVVPADWVDASTSGTVNPGYGYQWWVGGLPTANAEEGVVPVAGAPDDLFTAIGMDHQYTYVIPSLDLVVVRNAVYNKSPEGTVAEDGFVFEIMAGGLGEYGTQATSDWDSAAFLAPLLDALQP